MKLTGKQKCQVLIGLLGDRSSSVLEGLSEESTSLLSSELEDSPELTEADKHDFMNHLMSILKPKMRKSSLKVDAGMTLDEALTDDSGSFDEAEEEEPREPVVFPDTYRPIQDIAQDLAKQTDQMIAFFFSNADEVLVSELKFQFDLSRLEEIALCEVDSMPIASKIYERLFNTLVLKPSEEALSDAEEDSEEQDT